jgi:putative tricarboxylic transport membrane protein
MQAQEKKQPGETLFGLLMVAVSVFLLWQAYSISGLSKLSSPGTFPMSAAFIMLVFSCVTVVSNYKQKSVKYSFAQFRDAIVPNLVSFMIALILAYAVFLESVGFLVTSFSFLFLAIWVLNKSSMVRTFFLALLSVLVIYVVFRLAFSVVLPEGVVPEGEILAYIAKLFA